MQVDAMQRKQTQGNGPGRGKGGRGQSSPSEQSRTPAQGRGGGRGGRGSSREPSKYTAEEKAQIDEWKAADKCINCGGGDHYLPQCKVKGIIKRELREPKESKEPSE